MNFPYAIPSFRDNYIWLISATDTDSKQVIIVDPGDDQPVITCFKALQLQPIAIIITHHHYDHIDGIKALTDRYPIPVYGPRDRSIPGLTHPLTGGEEIKLDQALNLDANRESRQYQGLNLKVIATPGHTRDHLSYYRPGMLFCGDTLFAAGCGRLFDGTIHQLYDSLMWINTLPGSTRIYCTHEYTVANLTFALVVEPDNQAIQDRLLHCQQLRQQGRITLPSTLDEERLSNPFLRCTNPAVIHSVSQFARRELSSPAEVFKILRFWKNTI